MNSRARALAVGVPPVDLPRGRARQHSRVVRILRIVLPLVMVAVLGVLAAYVAAHAIRRDAAARRQSSAPIRMVNPHFFGRDSHGRAYILGASEAMRDESSFQRVLLRFPAVTLDADSPHKKTLTADLGVYHEDTRMLLLKGHVRGAEGEATRVATDEALVNTRTGTVSSQASVAGESAAGALAARTFDVYDKGDRVVLKGGVHARLDGK